MEYNEIDAIEGDVYGNTEIRELPDDPQNIPQGVKPHLNPNPGYGEDGKTVSALKTDLLEGERGVVAEKNTDQRGIKVVREPHNFIGGLLIEGKEIKTEDSPDKYGLEIIEWDGERNFTQEETVTEL